MLRKSSVFIPALKPSQVKTLQSRRQSLNSWPVGPCAFESGRWLVESSPNWKRTRHRRWDRSLWLLGRYLSLGCFFQRPIATAIATVPQDRGKHRASKMALARWPPTIASRSARTVPTHRNGSNSSDSASTPGPLPEPLLSYIDNVCGMLVDGQVQVRESIFSSEISGCLLGFRPRGIRSSSWRTRTTIARASGSRTHHRSRNRTRCCSRTGHRSKRDRPHRSRDLRLDRRTRTSIGFCRSRRNDGRCSRVSVPVPMELGRWQRHVDLRLGAILDAHPSRQHRTRLRNSRTLRPERRSRLGSAVAHQRWGLAGPRLLLARRFRRLSRATGTGSAHSHEQLNSQLRQRPILTG